MPEQDLIATGDILAGNYRVVRKIGAGMTGDVYLAESTQSAANRAAVKVLNRRYNALGSFRTAFLNEIHRLSSITHPNVVHVFNPVADDEHGRTYYMMPYAEDGTLRERLAAGPRPLPLAEALEITRSVASGLQAIHQAGIVHRDIKPGNVLCFRATDGGWRYALTDLGIAQPENTDITATLAFAGTPAYESPEQVRGERNVDARSDIYSLGALLYELVAGQPPFTGSADEVQRQHLYLPPPDVRRVRPEAPQALSTLIQKAMSKTADQRPQNAKAFLDELARIRPGGSGPALRSKLPLISAGVAAAVLVGAAALGVALLRSPAPAAGPKTVAAATATVLAPATAAPATQLPATSTLEAVTAAPTAAPATAIPTATATTAASATAPAASPTAAATATAPEPTASPAAGPTTAAGQPNTTDQVVFGDALAPGWGNWSWDSSANFESPGDIFTGTAVGGKSIAVAIEKPFGALSLAFPDGIKTDPFGGLAFSIRGGAGGNRIQFYLQATDDSGVVKAVIFTLREGERRDIRLSWDELANPAQVGRITFQDDSGAPTSNFQLDALRFYGRGGAPAGGATGSGDVLIYGEQLSAGWEDWSWDSVVALDSQEQAHGGSIAASVVYTAAYAGFSIRSSTEISTEGFTALKLWANGGDAGATIQVVASMDDDGSQRPTFKVTLPAKTWIEVTVPLSELGSPKQFTRLTFHESGLYGAFPRAAINFDDIRLVR